MSGSWITNGNGTRWVEYAEKKKRKPARALRFGDLKIGNQLMQGPRRGWHLGMATYYLVTDRWFDPVAGQRDPTSGEMAALQPLDRHARPLGRKYAHTLRGLASNGFAYADMDFIVHCQARDDAVRGGEVIGIGAGLKIRARPKIAGRPL